MRNLGLENSGADRVFIAPAGPYRTALAKEGGRLLMSISSQPTDTDRATPSAGEHAGHMWDNLYDGACPHCIGDAHFDALAEEAERLRAKVARLEGEHQARCPECGEHTMGHSAAPQDR